MPSVKASVSRCRRTTLKRCSHNLYINIILYGKVPVHLRSDTELDRFLLFCKVLWGLGSSELCYDPRVFINPQVLSTRTLLECPVVEEAVIIVLLIHSFQKGQSRNGLPLPERWDTNFLYILTSWDKAKELPYILHGIEPGVLLCCLIEELLFIVDIAVPVPEV